MGDHRELPVQALKNYCTISGFERRSAGGLTTVTICPTRFFTFACKTPGAIVVVRRFSLLTSTNAISENPVPVISSNFFDRRRTLVITGAPVCGTSDKFKR